MKNDENTYPKHDPTNTRPVCDSDRTHPTLVGGGRHSDGRRAAVRETPLGGVLGASVDAPEPGGPHGDGYREPPRAQEAPATRRHAVPYASHGAKVGVAVAPATSHVWGTWEPAVSAAENVGRKFVDLDHSEIDQRTLWGWLFASLLSFLPPFELFCVHPRCGFDFHSACPPPKCIRGSRSRRLRPRP